MIIINNKIIIGIIVVVIVIVGLFFITKKQPYQQQQNNPSTPVAASNTITIKNFSFSPATLTVKSGTEVTWVNEDGATHTIKSDTFNSQGLNQGTKFSFTFNNKGTFDYICGIHPTMKGQVVVE